jgi:hypothetical protein
MQTYITTYDKAEAEAAERKMNARRRRLGFSQGQIRSFQKSGNDGMPDRYIITLQDGEPVGITRDFSPIF